MHMRNSLAYALTSLVVACSGEEPDPDLAVLVDEVTSTGCTVVQSPANAGTPPYLISPPTQIVSEFTRPVFPHFIRQGSWTSGQFVRDGGGLTLLAVTANGATPGWIGMPFESGETVVGASLTICGDGTTAIVADTFATRVTTAQFDWQQDSLRPTGGGQQIHAPSAWGSLDIPMAPILMQSNSTLWMSVSVLQLSTVTPPPPPSMAISQVTLYLNH
jgi:hypothetical protein